MAGRACRNAGGCGRHLTRSRMWPASLTGFAATATSTSARRSFPASSTPRCGPPPSPTASFTCTVPADRRRAVIARRGQTLREAALADAIGAGTGTVAVAENPAERLAPDVNPTCQSRVLLMRPSESGAPGLNKAPAGPFDPAGLGHGESGAAGPQQSSCPGRWDRARNGARGFGARGSANSLTAGCDLVSMSPRDVICSVEHPGAGHGAVAFTATITAPP